MTDPQLFSDTASAFRYRSNRELYNARLLFSAIASPWLTKTGIRFVNGCMALHLPIKGLIKGTLFRQFCGGETLEEAINTAKRIHTHQVSAILDYGAEQKDAEADFDKAAHAILEAILRTAGNPSISFVSVKITSLARFALLEKKHYNLPLDTAEQEEWQRVHKRLLNICNAAAGFNLRILIDAEETWIQEPVNELTTDMMMRFNKKEAHIYNTFQLYCHGTLPFLETSLQHAEDNGYMLGAKLVRGAYMEKEKARAWKFGYVNPIQSTKEDTDHDFNAAVEFCLCNIHRMAVFIGTHNEESCLHTIRLMEALNIAPGNPRVYFSQLFGMSDHISFNLAALGYQVAKYLPYGPVAEVTPYLLRRAEENTSVAGQSGRELHNINNEIRRRRMTHEK